MCFSLVSLISIALVAHSGDCGWLESTADLLISSIPGPADPFVNVSLGNTLSPSSCSWDYCVWMLVTDEQTRKALFFPPATGLSPICRSRCSSFLRQFARSSSPVSDVLYSSCKLYVFVWINVCYLIHSCERFVIINVFFSVHLTNVIL